MKTVLLIGLAVFSFSGLAEERNPEIQKWDTIVAEKG